MTTKIEIANISEAALTTLAASGAGGATGPTGATGGVGATGVQGLQGATGAGGVTSTQVTQQIKDEVGFYLNMNQPGELSVLTGTARWYAPYVLQISVIRARLLTAADATVSINIKVNGVTQKTITFSASSTSATISNQSMSMNLGDYLTVDVTSIGDTVKGSDLYLQFGYNKV